MRASIPIQSHEEAQAVLGINDRNARLIRDQRHVSVTLRQGALQLEGEDGDVASVRDLLEELVAHFRASGRLAPEELEARLAADRPPAEPPPLAGLTLSGRSKRPVAPRTPGQQRFVDAMHHAEVVLAIGPAGTGKTYLAVAMALHLLREGIVKKLVLTRPAVEAGEKLGFLPGTFEAKVNPYLRPLYDALYDLVEPGQIRKFSENDVIEVVPLAYMRGRTLADSFIILDEGQNTSPAQMKMFLTRMGERSRMVVTGDITQIDLPTSTQSGLVHAAHVLQHVKGVRFCRFGSEDIIRHPVVQRIVDAYQREDEREGRG